MFVLSDRPADLFIFYPPGARGDFLASILKNTIANQYDKYIITPPPGYQKAHWASDILGEPIHKFSIKIRIKVSEVDEYLTVAHLWENKLKTRDITLPFSEFDSWSARMQQLIDNESKSQNLIMFDYVVNFKSLYDIEFIKNFYHTIRGQNLEPDIIKKIQHNINLQPWVKLSL